MPIKELNWLESVEEFTFEARVEDADADPVEVVVQRGEIVDVQHHRRPLRLVGRPRTREDREEAPHAKN